LKAILSKLANLESILYIDQANSEAQTFVVRSDQFFVPLQKEENQEELKEESEKELGYLEGFKKSVEAKLANEKFVQNAKPDLVEREKQKLSDTENKIKSLREILARFN
jgi:valyl-tRNA synthetase